MSRPLRPLVLTCVVMGFTAAAWGQQKQELGPGIYVCVDAKGRRLTSDRPIAECVDREQKQLNPSGTVRRTLGPSLTEVERAALEERERKVAEERLRQQEEKRTQRALLLRYPNQAVHDSERAKALQTARDALALGERRLAELQEQRRRLTAEAESHKGADKWPPHLKRQLDENEQLTVAQQRLIVAQLEDRKRIETRFDEELARLKVLWAQAQGTNAAAAPASGPEKR